MYKVRAKMQLVSKTEHSWSTAKTLRFEARYDDKILEDMRFYKATPSGHLEMLVDNPSVLENMKIGQYYYLDFTPVTE